MKRAVRWFAGFYFVAMALAVTYPGVSLVNTIQPRILGFPFAFAWVVMWVIGAGVTFYLVYRFEDR